MARAATVPDGPIKNSIKLDWGAYFKEFVRLHGEPLEYQGRLLFADGWTYSAKDYAGPEWPPPKDAKKLNQLQRAYWTIRLRIALMQSDNLKHEYLRLKELQQRMSLPLLHTTMSYNEEQRRRVRTLSPVDFGEIEDRLLWLEDEVAHSKQQLQELKNDRMETDR